MSRKIRRRKLKVVQLRRSGCGHGPTNAGGDVTPATDQKAARNEQRRKALDNKLRAWKEKQAKRK